MSHHIYLYEDLCKNSKKEKGVIVSKEVITEDDKNDLDKLLELNWISIEDCKIILAKLDVFGKYIFFKNVREMKIVNKLLLHVEEFERGSKKQFVREAYNVACHLVNRETSVDTILKMWECCYTVLMYEVPRPYMSKERGQARTLAKLYPDIALEMIVYYLLNYSKYSEFPSIGTLLVRKDEIASSYKKFKQKTKSQSYDEDKF